MEQEETVPIDFRQRQGETLGAWQERLNQVDQGVLTHEEESLLRGALLDHVKATSVCLSANDLAGLVAWARERLTGPG